MSRPSTSRSRSTLTVPAGIVAFVAALALGSVVANSLTPEPQPTIQPIVVSPTSTATEENPAADTISTNVETTSVTLETTNAPPVPATALSTVVQPVIPSTVAVPAAPQTTASPPQPPPTAAPTAPPTAPPTDDDDDDDLDDDDLGDDDDGDD